MLQIVNGAPHLSLLVAALKGRTISVRVTGPCKERALLDMPQDRSNQAFFSPLISFLAWS